MFIKKYEQHLSDGREIIYYDDADTKLDPYKCPDGREFLPRPETATMRQDPLTGEWVSIASARQQRVFLPPPEFDPLTPQTPTNPSETPANYDVAVFENKSPSFGPLLESEKAPQGLEDLHSIGMGRDLTSVGRCEVVCFTPERTGSFGSLTPSRARTVIEAWADRTATLSTMPNIQQVFPFENRGEVIGVTLHHPHGQIYAYPYITPKTQAVLRSIDKYGPTLFEDIIRHEQASERFVLEGQHWIAFVPFAARWPNEVHILPLRHVPDLAQTSDSERNELATFYLRVLRGIDALYDAPTPYIAAWHQAPVRVGRGQIRLMCQITSPRRAADKLKYLAGSEAAMGAWVGDIVPEEGAARLREAIQRAESACPLGELPQGIKGLQSTLTTKSAKN